MSDIPQAPRAQPGAEILTKADLGINSIGNHPGNQVMGSYAQCNAHFSKAAGATTVVTAPEPEQFSVEAAGCCQYVRPEMVSFSADARTIYLRRYRLTSNAGDEETKKMRKT